MYVSDIELPEFAPRCIESRAGSSRPPGGNAVGGPPDIGDGLGAGKLYGPPCPICRPGPGPPGP